MTQIQYNPGTTNTAGALSMVRNDMLSPTGDKPNIIVLFTDGGSNDYSRTLLEAAAVSFVLISNLSMKQTK